MENHAIKEDPFSDEKFLSRIRQQVIDLISACQKSERPMTKNELLNSVRGKRQLKLYCFEALVVSDALERSGDGKKTCPYQYRLKPALRVVRPVKDGSAQSAKAVTAQNIPPVGEMSQLERANLIELFQLLGTIARRESKGIGTQNK